jgi:perosamine synthetase
MLKVRVGDFKLDKEEKAAIRDVMESGRLSEGPRVREFEESWARFIGTRFCVAVNSGTSALMVALLALKHKLGLKDGAYVITSPLTFIATVNAVTVSGFKPLFVDVDPRTFVITPESVASALAKNKNVALILPVHLMGYPTRMKELGTLARKKGVAMMEDAAQAHGTLYAGKKLGSHALMGCFSFYIAHNVQAGEMGAVVTDDPELYRLAKKIKAHGRMCDCPVCTRAQGTCPRLNGRGSDDDFDPRFYHDMVGFNFKTMEFQAALGITQLRRIDDILRARRENVRYLNDGLEAFGDVLQLPLYSPDVSYLAYPLVIKKPLVISRKALRHALEGSGIETRPLFGCIPTQQPAYAHLRKKYLGRLPNAEYIGANGFYIGCHQYLTKQDLDLIIAAFRRILKGAR